MYNVTCVNKETPSRGWYSIFPFILSRTVDYGELRWSLKDDENLVLARIDINLCQSCQGQGHEQQIEAQPHVV